MDWTIADVQQRLDGIPPERIRTFPAPGTATEEDVLRVMARTDRICELVDGILVEKVMSSFESRLACILIHLIESFLEDHDLGAVLGEAGFLKLFPGLVRAPDVSFIRWERFPGDEFPKDAIWRIAPDLAVEILSEGNTEREMQRKLREYFKAGASRVWIVDPETRTTRIFTSPRRFTLVDENGPLDAGDVLPGFELSLKDWFSRAQRRTPRRKKR
jgi:Uma2 family endonuclease